MPNKSTAVNLRRLFLNLQSRADNMGSTALSLDATKAFDSIDWNYLSNSAEVWTRLELYLLGKAPLQSTASRH